MSAPPKKQRFIFGKRKPKGPKFNLRKKPTSDNGHAHNISTVNIEPQTCDMNENIDQDVFEDTKDPLAWNITIQVEQDKKRLKRDNEQQKASNENKSLENGESKTFECSYWDEEDLFTINENEET